MEQSVKNSLEQAQANGAGRRTKTYTASNGQKFTFQHPGARWYLQCMDRCKRNGELQQEKYADEILENVIISPKVESIDYFGDDLGLLNEVIQEIESFLATKKQQGK